MIFKIEKREQPFAQIDKRAINDNKLSAKSKGILIYLLSKPNDWQLNINDLTNNFTDGINSIRSGINELIDAGYIMRQNITENGKFAGVNYVVFEIPELNKPVSQKTACDKTAYGKTAYGKRNHNNIIYFTNKELNNKYFEWVKFRKSELKKKMPQTTIDLQIKFLNEYDVETAIKIIEQSMFNGWQGLFELKKTQVKSGSNMPDYYNAKYEYTLKGEQLNEYHKHLRNIGFKCIHSPTAGTIWRKPK